MDWNGQLWQQYHSSSGCAAATASGERSLCATNDFPANNNNNNRFLPLPFVHSEKLTVSFSRMQCGGVATGLLPVCETRSAGKFRETMLAASVALLPFALLLPSAPPTGSAAKVIFVVPSAASPSSFGATSPQPSPAWNIVASHLADRLPGFDERISSSFVTEDELSAKNAALRAADVIVALGLAGASSAQALQQYADSSTALLTHQCSEEVASLQRVGAFSTAAEGLAGDLSC